MNTSRMSLWLADVVLVLHGGVVLFVIGGLVLIPVGNLRGWSWVNRLCFRSLHLAVVGWVALQAWLARICPLTSWESQLRLRAGREGYATTFLEHWTHQWLYLDLPGWVFIVAYTTVALYVAWTWWYWPPRRGSPSGPGPSR